MVSHFERYDITPRVGWGIVWAPVVIVALAVALREHPATEAIMWRLSLENHPIELITFASLLAAGGLGLRLATKMEATGDGRLFAAFYALFGAGLIFVGMEEISWGQWFFHFETPEAIKAVNKQEEMNFHNLPWFHAPFEVLRVAFGVGGLVGAWLARIERFRPVSAPPLLVLWFCLIALMAAADVHNYVYDFEEASVFGVVARQVELLEMLIGCAALLYMGLNARQLARGPAYV